MKRLLHCISTAVCVLSASAAVGHAARGSIDPQVLAVAKSALEEQVKLLNGLDQIEYSMKREILSKPAEEQFVVRYTLMEARDGRFRCSWTQTLADGSKLDQSAAFDGKTYQMLDLGAGTCFLAAGLPSPSRLQLSADEFATSQFWFLCDSPREQNYFGGPSLERIRSKDAVARLVQKIQSVKIADYRGETICDVVFGKQVDRAGDDVVRRVILRIEDGFPLVTETLDQSGKLLMRYVVEEIGWVRDETANANFPFPAIAKTQYFSRSDAPISIPKLSVEYRHTIDRCTLNGQTSGEFAFDLSSVEKIYDQSTKTLIKVPR